MTVLITGSEGFLGKQLAGTLHADGIKVIGVDLIKPAVSEFWPVLTGDVTDKSFIEQIFSKHKIAHIVHCGGVSGPHVCNQDPAKVFTVNCQGTLNLFEIARLHKFSGRIIFLSSSSVYGEAAEKASMHESVHEKWPLLANEPYGCSKVACESMVRAFAHQFGMDMVTLRISIVYGPGRSTYCSITEALQAVLAGEPIVLKKGCDLPLPWVHINDVISVFQDVLKAPKEKFKKSDTLAYNVTGPGYPTIRQIAQIIKTLIPKAVIKESNLPDPYAMNARKMSLDAIKHDLGWEPKVTIEEGIKSLHAYLTKFR